MHPLVTTAKLAIEAFVAERKTISPDNDMPREYLEKRAGVFVTITKDGELRGCIGTHAPARGNIAQETIHNAIDAATNDLRFEPVAKDELAALKYEVYILGKPELVASLADLDPKVFGVMVIGEKSNGRGLLLPGLEGIDTIKQQLTAACQKGRINPAQEKLAIYRFRTEKFT